MSTTNQNLADELYLKLTNEEDARVCEDISDEACRATPRSFVLILASYFFTKLGDAVASPKTTLAWVCNVLGVPAFIIGFLVPVRESGSMLPQLFIGGYIRQLPVRKWVWVSGCVGQAAAVAGIGLVAFNLDGAAAGWAILGLVVVFSLSRGFCSIAAKDVLGKTIAKPRRGQLTGWSASVAGLATIGVGVTLITRAGADLDGETLGWLLIGAGSLWLIAASIYARVPEYRGATGGGRNALDALKRLGLVLSDVPFRRFIITRALLMCSALSAPFYVALAQSRLGSPSWLLGAFVAAGGLASLLSGPIWGRFADVSSRAVMIAAAVVTSFAGLSIFAVAVLAPWLLDSVWFLPTAYFVLSVAHSGVRVGRKTYVVNLGGGNRRTDYVAVSNTVIGGLLLLAGSVGALAPLIGNAGVIAVLAGMGLAGALYGSSLPKT
ncbi:MAG: hypothetical protein PVJ33_04185 [Lysobacterales bacterium]